jgi:hypothetical protein
MGMTLEMTCRNAVAKGYGRALLVLLLACVVHATGTAQIRVGVWTDKPMYRYGDTVRITVTAFNPSTDTAQLSFSTAAQANYVLNDYDFFARHPVQQIVTSRTIPPGSSISWDYLKYPSGPEDSSLSVGTYTLVGEVIGYGRSDTMMIIVTKGTATSVAALRTTCELFRLDQNYPNPFNPNTTITYALPKSSMVRLSVYDILGQEVSTLVNERTSAGSYQVKFHGAGLPSGVYVYRLQAGDFVQSKKLVVVK